GDPQAERPAVVAHEEPAEDDPKRLETALEGGEGRWVEEPQPVAPALEAQGDSGEHRPGDERHGRGPQESGTRPAPTIGGDEHDEGGQDEERREVALEGRGGGGEHEAREHGDEE